MYALSEVEWSRVNIEGDLPPPRYNHACVVYNNTMFIYSGLNAKEIALDDFYAFDFLSEKWKKNCNFRKCPIWNQKKCCIGKYDVVTRKPQTILCKSRQFLK